MPGCPQHSLQSGRPEGEEAEVLVFILLTGLLSRKSTPLLPTTQSSGQPTLKGLSLTPDTTHLPIEGHTFLGLDKVSIGQVGPLNHCSNRLLVLG